MGTISLQLPVSGQIVTAGLHSSNYGTLQTVINGGLDNNNFATGKIFDPTKLMQSSATSGQALIWNGTTWTPAAVTPTVNTWATLVDVVNTTTESDLVGTQGSGWTIPANTLGATDKLVINLEGDISAANATNPTTRFKLYLGGTVVIDTSASAFIGGAGTAHPFRSQIVVAMRGATNSYFARWSSVFANPGTASSLTTGWGTFGYLTSGSNGGVTEWTTAGDITLDMTASQALRATVTWGTAAATNELRIRQAKAVKS